MNTFACGGCGRRFHRIGNLRRHEALCTPCSSCGKYFSLPSRRLRHESTCVRPQVSETGVTPNPSTSVDDSDNIWNVIIPGSSKSVVTPKRTEHDSIDPFPSNVESKETLLNELLDLNHDGENAEELVDVFNSNWLSLKNFFKCHKIMDVLNVCLLNNKISIIDECFKQVLSAIPWKVKVNASVGSILVHKTTGRFRYFHSSPNNGSLFDTPHSLSSLADAENFLESTKSLDLDEVAFRARPNTEWRLFALTNMTFYFNKMIGISRAGYCSDLPSYIKNNRNILSLITNSKTGKRYNDKLCFFRCLAIKLDCTCPLERCKCKHPRQRTVRRLIRQYMESRSLTRRTFGGVDENDLLGLQQEFQITITVFELQEDKSSEVVWSSGGEELKNGRLNLNLYENHFSYIRNVNAYANDFRCMRCDAHFTRATSCRRHKCDVSDVTTFTFPGGAFSAPKSIWDEISEVIEKDIPNNLRVTPYRATFDIECLLEKDDLPQATDTLTFESRHRLLSISVCSNVPGYTRPKCFVADRSPLSCVEVFADYLEEISEQAYNILLKDYQGVISNLNKCVSQRSSKEADYEEHPLSNPRHYGKRVDFSHIESRLHKHLRILPVFGFNSQRYDLNILKPYLMRVLSEDDAAEDSENSGLNFVVKKQDSLSCVQTSSLRFLDACNFISPGFNYETYLKAHQAHLNKGFFPYEWMDDISKLSYTSLPPQSAFYSKLTGKHISDKDYSVVVNAWRDNRMTTVRDLLVWYNNLDVEPFLDALEKQYSIYASKNIDMGRQAISLPGLAVLWMNAVVGQRPSIGHNYTEEDLGDKYKAFCYAVRKSLRVQLINEHNKELHSLFRGNLIGGPSLVFHRYHAKDTTCIRAQDYGDAAKTCKIIQGYDANALYLYCMMQDMPVGQPIIRLEENEFRPSPSNTKFTSKVASGWLAWMELVTSSIIQTRDNDKEARIGQHGLFVDGYCQETKTVYQFHGCYWHGHGCSSSSQAPIRGQTAFTRLRETKDKEAYVKHLGYNFVSTWECEWQKTVRESPTIKVFLKAYFDTVFGLPRGYSMDEIVQLVMEDKIFGFVECDIHVPANLTAKFSEMSPIFKNVSLSRDDLSDHMREFAEANDFLKRPQRCLVGSLHAKKQLFLSTLLKWYLDHGLIVTHIYRVIQFQPLPVLKSFGESVSNARRDGDVDVSYKLLANNAKLVGNSLYGKTIINKTTHRNTQYTADERKASKVIRRATFHSLNVLEDDLFETSSFKKKHKLDEALFVGSTILQLSKLRMLQFHYDLVDRMVDRMDYQMINMDTDSSYMALTGEFLDCVKPNMLSQMLNEYGEWFVEPYCERHRGDFILSHTSHPRTVFVQQQCCKQHELWDSRTPGKFKLEFSGHSILALNAKTYICSKDDQQLAASIPYPTDASPSQKQAVDKTRELNKCKVSSKGLSKRTNTLTVSQFQQVLTSKVNVHGVNTGFIRKDNVTYTYTQNKKGLTYFYGKRKVLEDGVSTTHLDI